MSKFNCSLYNKYEKQLKGIYVVTISRQVVISSICDIEFSILISKYFSTASTVKYSWTTYEKPQVLKWKSNYHPLDFVTGKWIFSNLMFHDYNSFRWIYELRYSDSKVDGSHKISLELIEILWGWIFGSSGFPEAH